MKIEALKVRHLLANILVSRIEIKKTIDVAKRIRNELKEKNLKEFTDHDENCIVPSGYPYKDFSFFDYSETRCYKFKNKNKQWVFTTYANYICEEISKLSQDMKLSLDMNNLIETEEHKRQMQRYSGDGSFYLNFKQGLGVKINNRIESEINFDYLIELQKKLSNFDVHYDEQDEDEKVKIRKFEEKREDLYCNWLGSRTLKMTAKKLEDYRSFIRNIEIRLIDCGVPSIYFPESLFTRTKRDSVLSFFKTHPQSLPKFENGDFHTLEDIDHLISLLDIFEYPPMAPEDWDWEKMETFDFGYGCWCRKWSKSWDEKNKEKIQEEKKNVRLLDSLTNYENNKKKEAWEKICQKNK